MIDSIIANSISFFPIILVTVCMVGRLQPNQHFFSIRHFDCKILVNERTLTRGILPCMGKIEWLDKVRVHISYHKIMYSHAFLPLGLTNHSLSHLSASHLLWDEERSYDGLLTPSCI